MELGQRGGHCRQLELHVEPDGRRLSANHTSGVRKVGEVKRLKASAPTVIPVCRSTMGWKTVLMRPPPNTLRMMLARTSRSISALPLAPAPCAVCRFGPPREPWGLLRLASEEEVVVGGMGRHRLVVDDAAPDGREPLPLQSLRTCEPERPYASATLSIVGLPAPLEGRRTVAAPARVGRFRQLTGLVWVVVRPLSRCARPHRDGFF